MTNSNTLQRPRKYREDSSSSVVHASVKGWNDTHVIIDVYIDGRLKQENLSRPINRFMCEYGLNAA